MKNMAPAALAAVACTVALLATPDAARAQGAGTFRISMEGNLFSFDKDTFEQGSTSVSAKTKRYGILDAGLGIGAFGAVTESLLIGGRLHFAGANQDVPGGAGMSETESAKEYSVIPGLQYVLSPGSTLRPFFGAGLGVGGLAVDGGDDRVHMTLLLQGGVHLFATDSFSFDSSLGFAYLNGTQKQSGPADDLDYSGFRVMITLGISGWIGGREPTVAAQPAGGTSPWSGGGGGVPTGGGPPAGGGGWQQGGGTTGGGAPSQGGSAAPVQRSGEWMTTTTSAGGNTLEAYAKPAASTDEAGLRLTVQGQGTTQCNTLTLYRGDGTSIALPVQHQGNGTADVVTAQTTLSVLETWGADPQAALGLCDQRWPLGPDARASLQGFVRSVRDARGTQAPAGGGWEAPPPPSEPSGEQPPIPDPEQGAY